MFEPPEPPRRRWIWPAVVIVIAAILAASVAFGGPWYMLVLAAVLLWGFFSVRFLMSSRGRRILFSRFDERSSYRDPGTR